jgi:hypothetical protein
VIVAASRSSSCSFDGAFPVCFCRKVSSRRKLSRDEAIVDRGRGEVLVAEQLTDLDQTRSLAQQL